MTEVRPMERFPTHYVYGESAPAGWIAILLIGGLLLAASALWISQEIQAREPLGIVPVSPMQVASSPAPETVNLQVVKVQESQAPAVVLPSSSPKAASDIRPQCPANLVFHFPTGAIKPLPFGAQLEFDAIVGWAKQHEHARIGIEGHADAVGMDESNLMLSYQRAKTVAAMLERAGVSGQQVQIAAAGSNGLIAGMPKDADVNRRVTVQINDPDACRHAIQ